MTDESPGSSEETTARRQRVKSELGFWHPAYERLLELDPAYLDTLADFLSYPWREGPLDKKTKALVCLAVSAAPTLLYRDGIRRYGRLAFAHGASMREVLEVLQLVSVLGIHSISTGVPILVDEAGLPDDEEHDEATLQRIRDEFTEKREYWDEGKEPRLRVDPGHFEQYLAFSSYPWVHGELDAKTRELVYVAIDASVTHVFDHGTRIHVQNALGQGASRKEILEALQLATSAGPNSVEVGLPILMEVAREHGVGED